MNIYFKHVFSFVAIILFCLCDQAVAQENSSAQSVEEMRQTLERQQQQLERQERQLHELRQQMQELSGSDERKAVNDENSPSDGTGRESAHREAAQRSSAPPEDTWPGSFAVDALNTRFKIGGFAELNLLYDDGAILSKGQFITSTILTRDAKKAKGTDGQTSFSVQSSRLWVETRTPFSDRRVKTFLSGDFYGDALGLTPKPRLRQAYGEVTNILFGGDLLAGQVWTAFADLKAFPNTLDFEGPGSFWGTREAEIRWTKGLLHTLNLLLAVDSPGSHLIEGADSLTRWPDGVLSFVWETDRIHLKGTGMLRDLRAGADDGPTHTALGWGASASGSLGIPIQTRKDLLNFAVTSGEGIGSYFNDAPPDAVLKTNETGLESIPVWGYFVSYEHWWSAYFNSTLVYGALTVENRDAQADDVFQDSQYFSANLIWAPNERWLLGAEFLRGERTDKDGAHGSVNRYMLTTRFDF